MPVYNAEKYVSETIESTLKQSFGDFEFIIIDDGSTDQTLSIIQSYKDERIKVITNEHNFVKSLNIGLNRALGKYVARMDADDIMHIDRLKIQYAIMEEDTNITVCSSWMKTFGENINSGLMKNGFGIIDTPLLHLLKNNFIYHPTVMMRHSFLKENQIMYSNYAWTEDYKLWVDISIAGGQFFIDSEPLLYYRISKDQVRATKQKEQKESSLKIKKEILYNLIKRSVIKEELSELHSLFYRIKDISTLSDEDVLMFYYTFFLKNKAIIGY